MIGLGAQILARTVVQPGAVIGRGAIINSGAIIEHGARIGDFAHCGPGSILCGDVCLGQNGHAQIPVSGGASADQVRWSELRALPRLALLKLTGEHDLFDFMPWADLRKGFEMTADGGAQLDICV